MINLTQEEKGFILENLMGGEFLIKSDDVHDLLTPLDSWLTANGFDDNWDLTDRGREIQNMYEHIYCKNLD